MTQEFTALEAACAHLALHDSPQARRAFVLYLIERFKIDLTPRPAETALAGMPTGRTASMQLTPAQAHELARSLPIRPPSPPVHLKHPAGVQTEPAPSIPQPHSPATHAPADR